MDISFISRITKVLWRWNGIGVAIKSHHVNVTTTHQLIIGCIWYSRKQEFCRLNPMMDPILYA